MWKGIVLGALAVTALACGIPGRPVQTELEKNFGAAQNAMRARQIANPDAGNTLKAVEGINAATAPDVIGNYHRNQKAANQETVQRNQRDQGIVEVQGGGGGGGE
jgi:hypothetical protein